MVFNATFSNISVISWLSVLLDGRVNRRKPPTCRKSLSVVFSMTYDMSVVFSMTYDRSVVFSMTYDMSVVFSMTYDRSVVFSMTYDRSVVFSCLLYRLIKLTATI
jgi:hypothetical protein